MNPIKLFSMAFICFILSACVSAVSRQHNFEVIGSKSIRSNCKIGLLDRRAIIPQKAGDMYILVQNSSRITWIGVPFIPFIPTFIDGNKLNSLRLDVRLNKNGNSLPIGFLKGWVLHLDDQNIEGKVKLAEHEQQYFVSVHFDFSAIDAKTVAITIPPSENNQETVKLNLQRHLESEYFPFASGLTHYISSPCPEEPKQALPHTPGI